MKKDMDKIIFESRWEIGEVITALEEWQETHCNLSANIFRIRNSAISW